MANIANYMRAGCNTPPGAARVRGLSESQRFAPNISIDRELKSKELVCDVCGELHSMCRPRFFAGQLLTEEDLNCLEKYVIEKNKLHNRYVHGYGVVCGLQVVCNECEGWVTVKPGYAIDACGNDIIVPKEQDFNVIEAIKDCLDERRKRYRTDCSPLRSITRSTCEEAEETWCLTIEYDEQPTRGSAALRKQGSTEDSCCRGTSSDSYQSNPDAPVRSGAGKTVFPCEPTRTVEGYRLGVVPAPKLKYDKSRFDDAVGLQRGAKEYGSSALLRGFEPGTMPAELLCCMEKAFPLFMEAPNVANSDQFNTADKVKQACCEYRESVRLFLLEAEMSRCELFEILNKIECPSIAENEILSDYAARVHAAIAEVKQVVAFFMIDCFCRKLLPVCPPDPCDKRLILACMTVKDGKVLRICHFGGRKQLIGFPSLAYWLSALDVFFPVGSTLTGYLQKVCCGDITRLFGMDIEEPLMHNKSMAFGMSSAGMIHKNVTGMFGQVFGAEVMQSLRPSDAASMIDTRELVGGKAEAVGTHLAGREINYEVKSADAWPEEAVTAGKLFSPAAVPVNKKLVMYTKGEAVVGFDVVDETESLRREIDDLKKSAVEVQSLKAELNNIKKKINR